MFVFVRIKNHVLKELKHLVLPKKKKNNMLNMLISTPFGDLTGTVNHIWAGLIIGTVICTIIFILVFVITKKK